MHCNDSQSGSSFLLFLSYCCKEFHVRPTWTRQHRTHSAEEESTSWARRFSPGRHISAEHASAGYIFDKSKTFTNLFFRWGKWRTKYLIKQFLLIVVYPKQKEGVAISSQESIQLFSKWNIDEWFFHRHKKMSFFTWGFLGYFCSKLLLNLKCFHLYLSIAWGK